MPKLGAKNTTPAVKPRRVQYQDVQVSLARGDKSLTAETAKDLLGWTEDENEAKRWGVDTYQVIDRENRKVYCYNNVNNRPLYDNLVDAYAQEILNRRWEFNGEPIIIGKTGLVLDGQHTLIALVLAQQDLAKKPEHWPGLTEAKIEKLIVFGVEENDRVVNTMNTGKPRSLPDVIYRSKYFANQTASARKQSARVADYAIRLLWERTGANVDAWAPRRTHSEALDFIDRHPSLLKAVGFIMNEDKDKGISIYRITQGYAAAMLYLMGTSTSDGDAYREDPAESRLNLETWKKAEQFWVDFASKKIETLRPVKNALSATASPDTGEGGSPREKLGIIAKAWRNYYSGEKQTPESLSLFYRKDPQGIKELAEFPTFGGIDVGRLKSSSTPEEREEEDKKEAMRKSPAAPKGGETTESKTNGARQAIEELIKKHPGRILVMKSVAGGFSFWDEFADRVSEAVEKKPENQPGGLRRIHLTNAEWELAKAAVFKLGIIAQVETVKMGPNATSTQVVTDLNSTTEPGGKKKPEPKKTPKPSPKK